MQQARRDEKDLLLNGQISSTSENDRRILASENSQPSSDLSYTVRRATKWTFGLMPVTILLSVVVFKTWLYEMFILTI